MVARRIRQGDGCLRYETVVLGWQIASMQFPLTKIPGAQMEILTPGDDKLSKRQTILCKVRLSYPSVFLTFLLLINSPYQSLPTFLSRALSCPGSRPTETQ